LVGDIAISCTGNAIGGVVNVTVAFTVPVTSRVLTNGSPAASEALLLLNEPGSGLPGTNNSQITCDAASAQAGTCSPNANVFQGVASGANQVTFFNVPIAFNVEGTFCVLRITNLRINASVIPSNPGSVPVQATLLASNSAILPLTNPNPIVGFVQSASSVQLLQPDLSGPLPSGGLTVDGCLPLNQPLALNPANPSAPDGVSFVVRVAESFASAFLKITPMGIVAPDTDTRPPAVPQNIPGVIYTDETGFYNPAFPSVSGLNVAGVATQATRFLVQFHSPARGLQVDAPVYERGKGVTDSRVRLVSANADGSSSSYVPLGPLSTLNTYYTPTLNYVYEVTAIAKSVSPYALDTIDLPFYLAYAGPGPFPARGPTTVNVSLAPISTDGTPAGTWVPRFADNSVSMTAANLKACLRPVLTADILTHSGPANARLWPIQVTNSGTVTATNVQIGNLILTQTNGPACTPVVMSSFPLNLGNVPAGASATASAQIDFSGCALNDRFTAAVNFAADGGISGTTVFKNQFR
jgi:hypothetical protein